MNESMMLFYVDESGTGLGDPRTPYFILAALAISFRDWGVVDRSVTDLKRALVTWAKPEDFEIRGRDLQHGEKLFKRLSWAERLDAFHDISQFVAELPCQVLAVQVDKRDLQGYVSSHDQLYRLSLSRLLEEIESALDRVGQSGMLMIDSQSDLHSSVQDRRVIDAYRDWVESRSGQTRLIELPWFGFSAFYVDLQLADFCAYLVSQVSNEDVPSRARLPLSEAYARFQDQVHLVRIP